MAADTARCASFIGARKLRVTRLDECGEPDYGEKSQVVTNGFVSVEIEPETEEGEDYTTKTADGSLCISDKGKDQVKWYTVSIEFCRVDPDLFNLMNPAWKTVTNADGSLTTGWRMGQAMDDEKGFALELWPKASNAGTSCLDRKDQAEDYQVNGYFLLPWVVATAPDSWSLENDAVTFTLNGRTKSGALWGHGPYKVTRDKDGKPGRLVQPIDPGFDVPSLGLQSKGDPDHFHAEIVTVKPPDDTGCGARPLYNPDATAPDITVDKDSTDGMKFTLTVNNADAVSGAGGLGTVTWTNGGDHEPVGSDGKATHTYQSSAAGNEQKVTFYPGNHAEPVYRMVTPTESSSGEAARKAAAVDADESHTIALTLDDAPDGDITVDWGDGSSDVVQGSGPHRHTYEHNGTYTVVTRDQHGSELTTDTVTVPKSTTRNSRKRS